jgi:STE24 endopeptidase
MFDKFSPLPDGDLKTAITSLLESVDFKSSGVFTVEASKRDSRLNAYFGGLGKTKRVVLFDTLIEKLSQNELIAVLGHELGHFKHGDIIKNIALMGAILFATFFLISHIPISLANDMNMKYEAHFIIMMFLFLSSIIFFVISPFISFLSRHNEYEADKFGSDIGSADDLANALIKLVNENLSFPHSHPFYVFFYYSHPPLIERLRALGKDI